MVIYVTNITQPRNISAQAVSLHPTCSSCHHLCGVSSHLVSLRGWVLCVCVVGTWFQSQPSVIIIHDDVLSWHAGNAGGKEARWWWPEHLPSVICPANMGQAPCNGKGKLCTAVASTHACWTCGHGFVAPLRKIWTTDLGSYGNLIPI